MLDLGTPFDPARRQWLKAGASFLAGLLLAGPSLALGGDPLDAGVPGPDGGTPHPPGGRLETGGPPRTLTFFNTHTNEQCHVAYWRNGGYDPEALRRIDHILRDHRTEEVKEIDRSLLDLLHDLRRRMRTDAPFHVISGYRSQATNEYLHSHSNGVAAGSLHVQGRAIDLRVPGVRLRNLRSLATGLNQGGVGYYPRSQFVHVDVGKPRAWRG